MLELLGADDILRNLRVVPRMRQAMPHSSRNQPGRALIGGDGNGVLFKDFCWEEWKAKYGTSPPWRNKEFAQLADARHRIDTEQVARDAWTKFLADPEPFYAGHEPGKFLSSLSRWVAKSVPRQRRDKMQMDDKWSERTNYLVQLHKEVNADDSIHELKKRDEVSRRFKERFPA